MFFLSVSVKWFTLLDSLPSPRFCVKLAQDRRNSGIHIQETFGVEKGPTLNFPHLSLNILWGNVFVDLLNFRTRDAANNKQKKNWVVTGMRLWHIHEQTENNDKNI